MLSTQPKWVAKILNGEKTVEVRKRFPKDYRGWVYIYCTKAKPFITGVYNCENKLCFGNIEKNRHNINGKVVARFYCDNVEYYDDLFWSEEHEKTTCLKPSEYFDYMFHIRTCRSCYLIHISQLEIFDKPKELSEFKRCTEKTCIYGKCHKYMHCLKPLTKAPQSWCYVEVER